MPIHQLNHAVLYVRDVEASVGFYTTVLGFRVVHQGRGAAFVQAPDFYREVLGFTTVEALGDQAFFLRANGSDNHHDLGLFGIGEGAPPPGHGDRVGLYHLAWEVDTLAELQRLQGVLAQAGALAGQSDHGTSKSLYAKDPDGLEFEVCWLVPADRVDEAKAGGGGGGVRPLELDREIERYGAQTRGGVGVSVPA